MEDEALESMPELLPLEALEGGRREGGGESSFQPLAHRPKKLGIFGAFWIPQFGP